MNRDPEIFGKNTEDFRPGAVSRCPWRNGTDVSELKKDGHFSYGFGSRISVGRHMADNSLLSALRSYYIDDELRA